MTSPNDMREWERARDDSQKDESVDKKKHPWPLALRIVIALVGVYFVVQGFAQVKEGFSQSNGHAAWEQPAQSWQRPTHNGYGPQQQQPAQYGPQQQYPAQYGPQQPAPHYVPPNANGDDW